MKAVFFTDSRLVANQVSGEWRCLNPNMKKLRKKVRQVRKDFEEFELNYIPTKYVKQKLGH